MSSTAILAFSGDPITYGHIDMVGRALKVFDNLIVAIGVNPDKKYTFPLEKREQLTRQSLTPLFGDRITVKSFQGLLIDFAVENGVSTVIRGVRNSPDFSFEHMLNDINFDQNSTVDTMLLITRQNLSHVSSSAVKELQKNWGKNVEKYVPLVVKQALEETVSGQYLLGVTGTIGAGKSFICKNLIAELRCQVIDLDQLAKQILETEDGQIYHNVRQFLIALRPDIKKENGFVDAKKVGKYIFESDQFRQWFDNEMREPILLLLRRQLQSRKGCILIASALFVEADILNLVNNNVLLITANDDMRMQRLLGRGYSMIEANNRIKAQLSTDDKRNFINNRIKEYKHGTLVEFDNSDNLTGVKLVHLVSQIKAIFKE
jgi:pantetheine-phosphate adenylyltransferase/dephospho-CoA kinase